MTGPGPLQALFAQATALLPDELELGWYRQQFPAPDGLVLDALCGMGRVLVPLVGQGHKVHGVEPAPTLLARCDERVAAAGLATPTFRQDIAQLNLPFRYGGAYVADGALQAITDPALVQAALERIRAHLVAPGTLVVDCRVPPTAQQRLAAPLVEVRTAKLPDGSQIALRSETTWTPEARLVRAAHRYAHRRGAQRLAEEHATLRATWYAPEEMLEVVRAAGFRDARVVAAPVAGPADEAFAVLAKA
ncbi:MAG: class I SAM-dependent methyltransferase [Burkholderiales bacterium]